MTVISADSPQAKGRAERLFKTLQDRLVKGLRLAGRRLSRLPISSSRPGTHAITSRFSISPVSIGPVRRAATCGMSAVASCADHAEAESFFGRLKREWVS